MPRVRDTAICLRQRDWSETSQIITLLTHESGVVHGVAKGSRRPRSRFDGGVEPLTLGEVVFVRKPARELLTLTDWSVEAAFPELRRRLAGLASAMFAAEAVLALFAPLDPVPAVFERLRGLLGALNTTPDRTHGAASAVRFAWSAVDAAGHGIELEPEVMAVTDEQTLVLDPEAGVIRTARTEDAADWRTRSSTLRVIDDEDGFRATPDQIARAARLTAAWIRYRTGTAIESAEFLRRCLVL